MTEPPRFFRRFRRAAPLLLVSALAGCNTPSSSVDGGDLRDVFERDGAVGTGSARARSSAVASAAARPRSSGAPDAGADVPLPVLRRSPPAGPCVRVVAASPGARDGARRERPLGRPACRGARILEWRDPAGDPRYACVFEPRDLARRAPLPLLLFFHSDLDTPKAVGGKTKLGSRADETDLAGDPAHQGFVVLAPQGRRTGGRNRFDTGDVSSANPDLAAVDQFLSMLTAEGVVDRRRIYALGDGTGSRMALFYAMARPSLVAAYGLYAPSVAGIEWSCAEPPPPGWVGYRACDAVSPCPDVEQWLEASTTKGAAIASLRLDDGHRDEPSCDRSRRCKGQRADANHARWPKEREPDLLGVLGRYSLEVAP